MLAYYGDDFTGSTDALEALTRGGVDTVLFVDIPRPELLDRYPQVRAIGIAGTSRTMSPAEMDNSLPTAFEFLRARRPQFVHYKVCSTFDSSPTVGSIGRAIDIGHSVFQNQIVPLVVGAPTLQRFCVFGNLFARSGLDSDIYRLDRHPTMRNHPVTPMTEADLRVHLGQQTERPVALIDVLALQSTQSAAERLNQATRQPGQIVLFDTITDEHLATIGGLVTEAQRQEQKPLFVAGSSGVEYGLTKHWHTTGIAKPLSGHAKTDASQQHTPPVDRVLAVSGSCSPVTDRQIAWAVANGFAEFALDTIALTLSNNLDTAVTAVAQSISRMLETGRSVIAHTSRGPNDPRIALMSRSMSQHVGQPAATPHRLGVILGRILREVLQIVHVERIAVAGGDTAGDVARAVGVEALEFARPFAPGAPLCTARSADANIEGIEFTFKGGQVGHDDFFGSLLGSRGGQ